MNYQGKELNLVALREQHILERLAAPFAPAEIKDRPGGGGQRLAYADARAYQRRLDEVFPLMWETHLEGWESGIIVCRLTVTVPTTGRQISRMATADKAEATTTIEAQAFKRAASSFGVGRFLYDNKLVTDAMQAAMPEQVEELEQLGAESYGPAAEWPQKRLKMAWVVSQYRTKSTYWLTPAEVEKLVEGIKGRIEKAEAETA